MKVDRLNVNLKVHTMFRYLFWLSCLILAALLGGVYVLTVTVSIKPDMIGTHRSAWATDSRQDTALAEGETSALDRHPADSLEGDPAAIEAGKRIFHTYCWGCHGRNGTGAQCPDFTDDVTLHGETYQDLVNVVTNGVRGAPMGSWKYALGRTRIRQVVAYVYSLKGTRKSSPNQSRRRE